VAKKLSHGAQYYYLTRDAAFIEEHTDTYIALCEEFRRQMAEDPYGLLLKQRQCGGHSRGGALHLPTRPWDGVACVTWRKSGKR
jgi:hypothetical protein